ncbi:DUF1801 domain-containing protein [Flavobacterium cerinum]|uniref:DUF1801 domain-containing protein n=1 Tax=Flavobacterium cerinum TaxID=2502784 RepID=A0ABY5IVB4_9FLAO|nr:DUF1801 domain-containing protein [Flavobacterium cerinum]UUC45708.1 DUF1801 domain-containing protein [Flavobacterium cerinum]
MMNITVTEHIQNRNHPLTAIIMALRQIILEVDNRIAEQIKWNSPSFYYSGAMKPFDPKEYKRDIVVFNLHKEDCVLLVFPTGATIHDTSGLLEGKFTDSRKVVLFKSIDQVMQRKNDLQAIITEWLRLVDTP